MVALELVTLNSATSASLNSAITDAGGSLVPLAMRARTSLISLTGSLSDVSPYPIHREQSFRVSLTSLLLAAW